jgi:signal transduction histidine kinase
MVASPQVSNGNFATRIRSGMHSIRFRLTLWFVAILALILAGFSALIYSRQVNEFSRENFGRLESQAHQLEAYYRFAIRQTFEQEHGETLPPDAFVSQMPLLQIDEAMLLVDPNGQVIQKLGPMNDADIVSLMKTARSLRPTPLVPVSPDSSDGGMPLPAFTYYLAITQGISTDYQFVVSSLPIIDQWRATLLIGGPVDPGSRTSQLLLTLLLSSLGILFIASAGGYWLATRAMHPVQIITRTAHSISESDLSRRLKMGGHDELSELADTFDQMLDRLQAGFERQRQFTADASHELRTPLTIIELEAGRMLEHPRTPEEYERALGTIKSENDLMGRIVNDLLTLARMDAGQTIARMESLDLSDVALDVVERLTPLASQRRVELIMGELPEILIRGDRQLLIQMLTNLVENAIKYSAPSNIPQMAGAVRMEGSTELRETHTPARARVIVDTGLSGTMAYVRVEDNGPGISADYLPKLFDRFFRVDQVRQHDENDEGSDVVESRPGGNGLGLSIVQWIVRSHNGQIDVQSEVGKGSTFEVRLPSLSAQTRL